MFQDHVDYVKAEVAKQVPARFPSIEAFRAIHCLKSRAFIGNAAGRDDAYADLQKIVKWANQAIEAIDYRR